MPPRSHHYISKAELTMPSEELRRNLNRYRKTRKSLINNPKFTLLDLVLMARCYTERTYLYRFLNDKIGKGRKVSNSCLKRLAELVLLVEKRMVTKSQLGVYHFHDTPQSKPVREMRVSFGKFGAQLVPGIIEQKKPTTMPSFGVIFGRKI